MVPGDIYIGKATLVQYEIRPVFAGNYDGPDDIVVEHLQCGESEVLRFDDYDTRAYIGSSVPELDTFVRKNPWDILDAILKHEKECPKKCKTVASPAEDSSMTNAETTKMENAAVEIPLYGKMQRSPSRANGNVYASTQEVVEFVERVQTVKPNPNVL